MLPGFSRSGRRLLFHRQARSRDRPVSPAAERTPLSGYRSRSAPPAPIAGECIESLSPCGEYAVGSQQTDEASLPTAYCVLPTPLRLLHSCQVVDIRWLELEFSDV